MKDDSSVRSSKVGASISVEFDGKFTVSYLVDGEASAFRCAPKMGRLIAAAPDLADALREVDCDCSIRERDSGHKIGCYMPAVNAALAKL